MDNIDLGLYIFGIGMVILFLALGLLALMIDALGKIFQDTPAAASAKSSDAGEAAVPDQAADTDAIVAVAVAVGHLLSRQKRQSGLGKLLEKPPGHYRFR